MSTHPGFAKCKKITSQYNPLLMEDIFKFGNSPHHQGFYAVDEVVFIMEVFRSQGCGTTDVPGRMVGIVLSRFGVGMVDDVYENFTKV